MQPFGAKAASRTVLNQKKSFSDQSIRFMQKTRDLENMFIFQYIWSLELACNMSSMSGGWGDRGVRGRGCRQQPVHEICLAKEFRSYLKGSMK